MLTRTAFRVRSLARNSRFSTWSPHIEPDSGDRNSKNIARPSTVPWSDHLHNSVSLIGTVTYQPKRFDFKDGGLAASTVLLVKPRPPFRAYLRVTLTFWDLLAERALAHLKPKDCIYVSGQLRSYKSRTLEGTERMYYKVLAKELNYVQVPDERCLVAAESGSVAGECLKQNHMSRLALWQSLFANLDEWHDFRKTKKHPRQPDFVHKKTNETLWLNPEDPSWVKKHVELLDSGLAEMPEMPFGSFTSDCVSGHQLASSDSTQHVQPKMIHGSAAKVLLCSVYNALLIFFKRLGKRKC